MANETNGLDHAARERLSVLLKLAVAIGKREGFFNQTPSKAAATVLETPPGNSSFGVGSVRCPVKK